MGLVKLEGFSCERCNHKWISRENSKHVPIVCPKCLPPDALICGEFREIKSLKINDNAYAVSGFESKIQQVFSHDFTGDLIEIHAQGCLPIKTTPDHKILVTHVIQKSRSKKRRFSRQFLKPAWVEAKDIITRPISENVNSHGDYLIIPKLKADFNRNNVDLSNFTTKHGLKVMIGKNVKSYFPINKDSAWILGLYVAEGVSSSKGEITLCLGKHEKDLINETLIKINNLGLSFNVHEGETTQNIIIYSRLLSRAFKEWCGKDCYTKKVPYFIFANKDLDIIKNFIEGYVEGDGFIRKNDGRTQVIASTVSRTLALQLQLLSVKLNSFFNITKVDFSKYESTLPNGRVIKGGNSYRLMASAGYLTDIFHEKAIPRRNKSYVVFKNYVAVPINNLKRIEYSGKVMNLQTEEGNYLYNNLTVKNCKSPYWNIPKKGGKK